MSQSVFQEVAFYKQSFFQKLFKQFPDENALIELNNLLATKNIKNISKEDILKIEGHYSVSLNKEFSLNLEEFYAVYLNYCLRDKELSDHEIEELRHLKLLLGLNDVSVNKLHNQLSGAIYEASFKDIVKNGKLSSKEKNFIEKLQNDLRLDDELANKISHEVKSVFLNDFIKKVVADGMLSPEEDQELAAISKSLNVQLDIDQKTKDHLQKLKLFWVIENGELPVCNIEVNLQKNEVCYYTDYVEWLEQRRGSWTVIDKGNVYFTNKRVVFMGQDKNSNIRFEKILSCTIRSNGVEIDKDSGKTPILKPKGDIEVMGRMLKRLIK